MSVAGKGKACLGDETLVRLSEGRLSPSDLDEAEVHLDRCADCRQLVAAGGIISVEHAPPQTTATSPALSPGRYHPVELLGRGGMGTVYRAHDPSLKREVALKVVSFSYSDPERRNHATGRLLREAETLARLSHPNIVTVYDVGAAGDDVFVAMELVRGQTLRRWLEQKRSVAEIVHCFTGAARGLAAAHEAGVIHRDFKPDNVMVSDAGRVVVLDFGLARIGTDDGPLGNSPVRPLGSSPDSAFMGTPRYMAPEQVSKRPTDHRTDQYSFCIALYEAIYRASPALSAGGPRSLEFPRTPAVPRRVKRALRRGLARSPEERFPTMSALVQELAPSGGWLRGPRGVLLASAILGAALAGTLFATFGPEPAPANSESQPDVLAAGTHETTPGALAEAYEFLTRNVEGKRFEKSWTTAVVEEGRLEADSRDVEFIHDVVLEGNRLTFRRTIEAEQFNYRLDESGERILPGEPVDRSGTRQYAFSLRQETGAILGVSFPMHASGWEESLRLTVENDRLIITGKSATEFDRAFTGDGEWKPAVFRFTHTWKRTGERVEKRLLMYGYDYDTERHAAADEPYMTLNITLQEQK